MGLIAMALVRQLRHPVREALSSAALVAAAGLIYGMTFFVVVVEGGTGPLGVPAAALLALATLVRPRARLRHEPVTAFVLVAHTLAVVLFAAWWLYWGGRLPQFTEVGLF